MTIYLISLCIFWIRRYCSLWHHNVYATAWLYPSHAYANILSCALLGCLYFIPSKGSLSHIWEIAIFTGFFGGFSTFSTFTLETFKLLQAHQFWLGILNISLNLAFCLLGLSLGWLLKELFYQ